MKFIKIENRVLKVGVKVLIILALLYAGFYLETILLKGKYQKFDYPKVKVEVGDIIYRSNSYLLVNSKAFSMSGFPGHIAVVLSEGTINPDDGDMGNVVVAEARYHDRKTKAFSRKVSIQKASENFGDYKGRRLLLKTHLTPEQKQKLTAYATMQCDKPYRFFVSKKNEEAFNCATLIRNALLHATGYDYDENGGIVFPVDLVRCEKFDAIGNRINF